MRTLYMTTAGSSDPTRASIPLHLAVNGSLEVGHDVGVVLAGDATELLKAPVRDSLEGVGVPPVRDLLAKAQQHNLPIYVWKACAVAREATDDDLTAIGGQWVTPPDVARLIETADRFVSIWRFEGRTRPTEGTDLDVRAPPVGIRITRRITRGRRVIYRRESDGARHDPVGIEHRPGRPKNAGNNPRRRTIDRRLGVVAPVR